MLTDQELNDLAEKLFDNGRFIGRLASAISASITEPKSKISSKVKQELEKHFVEYKKKKTEEITKDLDRWFYVHLKSQIERSKENVGGMFDEHIDDWLNRESSSAFHEAANRLVDEIVREKLAKKSFTFTISDFMDE